MTPTRRMVGLVAVLASFAQPTTARADPADDAPVVVLLSPDPATGIDAERSHALRTALEAHLRIYDVVVLLEGATHPGADIAAVAARYRATAVVWLEDGDQRFGVLAPGLSSHPSLRHIPDTGEGWAARCEVMAAVLLSELSPLLAGPQPGPLRPTGDALADPPVGEVDGGQSRTKPAVNGSASMAYAPTILAAEGPVLHGLALGLGLRFGRHLEFGLGFDAAQPARLDALGDDAALARWPVRLVVRGLLSAGSVEIGVGAGAVVEPWQVRGQDVQPAIAQIASVHVDAALALALRLRVVALPWLTPFADFGVDAFPGPNRYRLGGDVVLERAAVQPRLVVGVALWIGAR